MEASYLCKGKRSRDNKCYRKLKQAGKVVLDDALAMAANEMVTKCQ